jgi:hypothetical protein
MGKGYDLKDAGLDAATLGMYSTIYKPVKSAVKGTRDLLFPEMPAPERSPQVQQAIADRVKDENKYRTNTSKSLARNKSLLAPAEKSKQQAKNATPTGLLGGY